MPVQKFNVLPKCLLSYAYLIVYPKYIGSGIQAPVKSNEILSVMIVCIHGFHNDVMACLLQIGESTIYRIFVAWVVFMEATFSCLNLKLDDGFLPYSMLEIFNITGHDLTDITIS